MRNDDDDEETSVADSSGAPSSERNRRTIIVPPGAREAAQRQPPLASRAAFIAVYDQLRQTALLSKQGGVIAAGVDPKGKLVAQSVLEDGRVLTIGRHTQCAFRLRAEDVSLRHLAAHVTLDPGGGAVTRLWDLKSGQPFATEDGVACSAVIGEGPLFINVGSYALLLVSVKDVAQGEWPIEAEKGWEALAPRQFIDRRDAEVREEPAPNRGTNVSFRNISRITRVGAPILLGADEALRGPAWAEVAVKDANGTALHRISALQIDRGVLVGRSSRCQVGLGSDDTLSRVHLLLVRIAGEVWAIDTASTNGTSHTECDVEAVTLRDRDSLKLSTTTVVYWKRTGRAEA